MNINECNHKVKRVDLCPHCKRCEKCCGNDPCEIRIKTMEKYGEHILDIIPS